MRRAALRSALLAGALAAAFFTGVRAAPAASRYDLTLGVGALVNDNLHLDPEEGAGIEGQRSPLKETLYVVVPGFLVDWREGRDRLHGEYRGEYWTAGRDDEPEPFWVHAVAADLAWRRWSPFFLELREVRSRVPRSSEGENEAYIDQIDENRIVGRAGGSWDLSGRTTLEVAYRVDHLSYPGSAEVDEAFSHGAEGVLRNRLNPLWQSTLRLSYGATERDLVADYTTLSAFGALDQRWDERITLRYQLEWRREDAEREPPGGAVSADAELPAEDDDLVRDGLLVGAELRWRLARGGSWTLAYQEVQLNRPDGDTLKTGRASAGLSLRARLGSGLNVSARYEDREYRISGREETVWGPSLNARWVVAPWVACDIAAGWASASIRAAGLPEVEDRSTVLSAAVVFLIRGHVQLEAGYVFRENDSSDAAREYTNHLVFTALTWRLRAFGPGELPPLQSARLIASADLAAGVAVLESERPPWQSTPDR